MFFRFEGFTIFYLFWRDAILLPFSSIIFFNNFLATSSFNVYFSLIGSLYFSFSLWAELSVSNRTFKGGLSVLITPNDLFNNYFEVVGLFLKSEINGWAGGWDMSFYFFFWSSDWRGYCWIGCCFTIYYCLFFTKGL